VAVVQATTGYGIFIFNYAAQLKIKTLPLRILLQIGSCTTIKHYNKSKAVITLTVLLR
jgi:hypothetical protein